MERLSVSSEQWGNVVCIPDGPHHALMTFVTTCQQKTRRTTCVTPTTALLSSPIHRQSQFSRRANNNAHAHRRIPLHAVLLGSATTTFGIAPRLRAPLREHEPESRMPVWMHIHWEPRLVSKAKPVLWNSTLLYLRRWKRNRIWSRNEFHPTAQLAEYGICNILIGVVKVCVSWL